MDSSNTGAEGYFCIVQTVEASRPVLSIVPHKWVIGKYLWWPQKKIESLVKDVNSEPSPTWTKIPCSVKRKFIPTFEAAETEAAYLSGHTTDTSDTPVASKKRMKNKPSSNVRSMLDLNYLMEKEENASPKIVSDSTRTDEAQVQLRNIPPYSPGRLNSPSQTEETIEVNSAVSSRTEFMIPEAVEIFEQNHDGIEQLFRVQHSMPDNECVREEKIKKEIFEKIDQTKNEIINTVLHAMENIITQTISAVQSNFDAKISNLQNVNKSISTSQSFQFYPITTIVQLDELEMNLEVVSYADNLNHFMRNIIGISPDTVNGQNTCYVLVDKFFDRKFLTLCSWTGASNGEYTKYALRKFKNVLNMFFSIVKGVNESFSMKLLEDFFKRVLRNAKKRSEAKGLRISSIHHKTKKTIGKYIMIGSVEEPTAFESELDDSEDENQQPE